MHDDAAEEAARAAKRYHDQIREIEMLNDERDEWKVRALTYEKEIERLERREAELIAQLEQRVGQLMHERDTFKNSLQALISELNTAGGIVLRCIEAANKYSGPKADLKQLTSAVEAEVMEQEPPKQADRGE